MAAGGNVAGMTGSLGRRKIVTDDRRETRILDAGLRAGRPRWEDR